MKKKMKELVSKLNEAARVYYNEDREIMSNYEYDALFDELQRLEEETGTILKDSPTQRAGYKVSGKLKKVEHKVPDKGCFRITSLVRRKTRNLDA